MNLEILHYRVIGDLTVILRRVGQLIQLAKITGRIETDATVRTGDRDIVIIVSGGMIKIPLMTETWATGHIGPGRIHTIVCIQMGILTLTLTTYILGGIEAGTIIGRSKDNITITPDGLHLTGLIILMPGVETISNDTVAGVQTEKNKMVMRTEGPGAVIGAAKITDRLTGMTETLKPELDITGPGRHYTLTTRSSTIGHMLRVVSQSQEPGLRIILHLHKAPGGPLAGIIYTTANTLATRDLDNIGGILLRTRDARKDKLTLTVRARHKDAVLGMITTHIDL